MTDRTPRWERTVKAPHAAAAAAAAVGLAAYTARRSLRLRAAGHVLRGHAVVFRMRITGEHLDLAANGRVPRFVYDTWIKDPARPGRQGRTAMSSTANLCADGN